VRNDRQQRRTLPEKKLKWMCQLLRLAAAAPPHPSKDALFLGRLFVNLS
jgi:hypothetical protein